MKPTKRSTRAYFRSHKPDPVVDWVAMGGFVLLCVFMVGVVVRLIASVWRAVA